MESATTAKAVEEIGKFFQSEWYRRTDFEGWHGLPPKYGQAPTREEANEFFLACCIDYMTKVRVVEENARRFCRETVPEGQLATMWEWIACHPDEKWHQMQHTYRLHRFGTAHRRILRIARTIVKQCDGDVRQIWAERDGRRLLATLEDDLKVGPAIARMIIGALRDHGLVKLKTSDLKPDRHVCRLMYALKLSSSENPRLVLEAANTHFDNPWLADICLYQLGADHGVKTAKQFRKVYSLVKAWSRVRIATQRHLEAAASSFCKKHAGWAFDPCSTPHWAGTYIYDNEGGLAEAMKNDLWAWIGIGFSGNIACWIEIGDESHTFLVPTQVRRALKAARFELQDGRGRIRESWVRSWLVKETDLVSPHLIRDHIRKGTDILMGILDQIGRHRPA